MLSACLFPLSDTAAYYEKNRPLSVCRKRGGYMIFSVIITVGIASAIIISFCMKALRVDKRRGKTKSFVLVPCTEQTEGLEMTVKSAYWEEVFSSSDRARDIIILTHKGSPEEITAVQLAEKYSIVHCVYFEQLEEYLKK